MTDYRRERLENEVCPVNRKYREHRTCFAYDDGDTMVAVTCYACHKSWERFGDKFYATWDLMDIRKSFREAGIIDQLLDILASGELEGLEL